MQQAMGGVAENILRNFIEASYIYYTSSFCLTALPVAQNTIDIVQISNILNARTYWRSFEQRRRRGGGSEAFEYVRQIAKK